LFTKVERILFLRGGGEVTPYTCHVDTPFGTLPRCWCRHAVDFLRQRDAVFRYDIALFAATYTFTMPYVYAILMLLWLLLLLLLLLPCYVAEHADCYYGDAIYVIDFFASHAATILPLLPLLPYAMLLHAADAFSRCRYAGMLFVCRPARRLPLRRYYYAAFTGRHFLRHALLHAMPLRHFAIDDAAAAIRYAD